MSSELPFSCTGSARHARPSRFVATLAPAGMSSVRGDMSKASDQLFSPAGASTSNQPFFDSTLLPSNRKERDQRGMRKRTLPGFSRVTDTQTGVSA